MRRMMRWLAVLCMLTLCPAPAPAWASAAVPEADRAAIQATI